MLDFVSYEYSYHLETRVPVNMQNNRDISLRPGFFVYIVLGDQTEGRASAKIYMVHRYNTTEYERNSP